MSVDAPLVSIGLPTYNGERYLAAALDSLLAQDYPNFEIVISDNASTDQTPQIIAAYAAHEPRIRPLRNERNIGVVSNTSRTIQEATGEFFVWAADDDLWAPDLVSSCLALIRGRPEAVLGCSLTRLIDEDGAEVVFDYPSVDSLDLSGPSRRSRVRHFLRGVDWPQTVAGVIRREALAEAFRSMDGMGADIGILMGLVVRGPVLSTGTISFYKRVYQHRSWAAQGERAGGRMGAEAIGDVIYTRVQETISAAIDGADLPWLQRLSLKGEVVVAVYLSDTWLHRQVRPEVPRRLRMALETHRPQEMARWSLLLVAVTCTDLGRKIGRSLKRIGGRP